ncbi:MAG: FAD-dependent oxidoreductase [Deltaproteobacteria bacterium]|nr:FAD-dependent oxidoreductase [Nannocystaceae bacterium]
MTHANTKLDAHRSEARFEDFKAPYTREQAIIESNRCLYCHDAPCVTACPTGIDIPQFIRKIGTDNVRGSARTIMDANIHGMSCARVCPVEVLCVGACVHNLQGVPPIQIGKLQRYATDIAYENGWRFFEAGVPTGKSVALVGAGPASLACAHELRRFGHACTIYDKRPVVGGLNTTGVAPYKMRADRSIDEVEWILGIGGIEVKTGVEVGSSPSWAELEAAHDAVFLGFGLGVDTPMNIAGEELPGVYGAVDFIERMKLGKVVVSSVRNAVVVGGGNTALDAVRELLGLGARQVTLMYRGTEAAMSGYAHEWEAGRLEGARVLWQSLPIELVGRDRLERVRYVRVDDDKRPIPGTELELDAELVLIAIGQAKLGELVAALPGVRVERGRVVVDADGFTGRAKVFAGGDCANGGKEVVNASAEGKRAARAIHRTITGA